MEEEFNGKTCIIKGCNNKLKGRQRKYCSLRCKKFADKHKNRHYYLKYHLNNQRRIRMLDILSKRCVVCGKQLGKYKRKYCSPSCQKIAKQNDHINTNWYTQEQYIPEVCEECGGQIIQDYHDIVCKDCGLVYE
jgi:predicted nucleic acid-binding Zn ribbon protein